MNLYNFQENAARKQLLGLLFRLKLAAITIVRDKLKLFF